jgi:hypothetical protein
MLLHESCFCFFVTTPLSIFFFKKTQKILFLQTQSAVFFDHKKKVTRAIFLRVENTLAGGRMTNRAHDKNVQRGQKNFHMVSCVGKKNNFLPSRVVVANFLQNLQICKYAHFPIPYHWRS